MCLRLCAFVCMCSSARVDLCRSRRASPKFRDAGLISCGSGSRLQLLDRFPSGSPSSPLMGLPRVEALCAGCQKVKVPYSSGTLQSFCRFAAYSDPSVPFSTGGTGSVGERGLRHFLGKSSLKNLQKQKDSIFIVSVSAFMWDPVSSL